MKQTSNPIPGFLLIDKPVGLSSFDVIRRLRKITSIRKMGHTGTLDPFASGLMIYSLNSYTRLCNLLESADKTYEVEMKFGEQTDSGDNTGQVVKTSANQVDESSFSELANAVLSLEKLPIPQYSAVKIAGKRAYEYARKNEYVEIPEREVRIHEFEINSYDAPYLRYSCRVSKGTYIRSLSEWIASFLGTVGHTSQLKRTAINTVPLESSTSLDLLDEQNWSSYIYPVPKLFEGFTILQLTNDELDELRAGRFIENAGQDAWQIIVMDSQQTIRSIANRQDGKLHPKMNLV